MLKTDRNTVLTLKRRRFFIRQVRQYMLACRAVDIQTEKGNRETKMSHSLLEKVLKAFKTHRCTANIDNTWISKVFGTMNSPIPLE